MKRFYVGFSGLVLAFLLIGCGGDAALLETSANPPLTALAESVVTDVLPVTADLTGDGVAEQIELRKFSSEQGIVYELCVVEEDGTLLWSEQAMDTHSGWNALFLCPVEEKDYLLRYRPTMYQGVGSYSYQLFSLNETGEEVVLTSDALEFDTNFDAQRNQMGFDPEAIAAFLQTVNVYLTKSTVLFNNDAALRFPEGEPPQDVVLWLREGEFPFEESDSLLENLRAFRHWGQERSAAQA